MIYDKKTNTIREKATMEAPEFKGDYFLHYGPQKQYEQHISSLKSYPCHHSCKELWEDGEDYKEGEDYELHDIPFDYCEQDGTKFGEGVTTYAVPIQEESEDELKLWMEAYAMLDHFGEEETMKHFTIKRKV